ncbi:MAG: hypothetical protein HYU36_16215 [Planctomycetes bacterium]|nr:hypothetical protein [Planctomycetota bacterium]
MTETFTIENAFYRLEFASGNGALIRLRDNGGDIELIAEPRLADNFRLLLPLPGMEANYILGKEQKLTAAKELPQGIELHWAGPLRNERGSFDLDVTLLVEWTDASVRFQCAVCNGTDHQLTEVWCPIIGGSRGLGSGDEGAATEVVVPTLNSSWRQQIFTDFGNTRGQLLGTLGAEHSFCYPGFMAMPWISLFRPDGARALYFAALEDAPRVKAIRLALDPGLAGQRAGGDWPRPEEVGDHPLGITMNWVHFPYTRPGETFESAPLVLQCHDGDWRDSAAIYRQWFTGRHPPGDARPSWMRRETAFVHTMFMLPEDNINLRFTDIPRWAKDAKKFGVKHVMLAGWQTGGHDRGYPYYEPDRRLGTWEELAAGIRACHDMGLRVSFFVNCQPIDMTTEWYQRELHRYRILDPHGEQYFIVNYWGMGTLSARMRFVTATPFTEMNPAHPEVRALLIRQFRKLVEIGADGLHIDKFFQTPFDFNPRLKGTSPDRAHHEGILRFAEELLAACREIHPEFCFSYEGGWDRLMPYSDLSWWGPADDVMKQVFPERAHAAGIEQPYDFNKVNAAVLRGCHLLVGPANYNRGMDYPPMRALCEYIGEITRIRNELFDMVSRGEWLDASEGLFQRRRPLLQVAGAFASDRNARWCIFRDPNSGQRTVILANLGRIPIEARDLAFADAAKSACRVHQAFAPVRSAPLPVTLMVPAERVIFVTEER